MTNKTKDILKNVFTFGIYGAVVKSKAKKQMQQTNNELKSSNVKTNNLDEIIMLFGGIENIKNVDHSIYSLKVEVKNFKIVNIPDLKVKLNSGGGTLICGNKITLNIGDNAPTVADQLKQVINLSNESNTNDTKE